MRPLFERMQIASLKSAACEQDLNNLSILLGKAVPDLSNQYTTFKVDSEYLRLKVRFQHAFQMKLALKAIKIFKDNSACRRKEVYTVDIGDSSGNHLIYLRHILSNDVNFNTFKFRFLSVNLDPIAVDKIRSKGMEAILCNAEALFDEHNIKADLFLSYEMLEHLYDPISFLEGMLKSAPEAYFVLTVPYMAQSRVGLHHIRHKQCREVYPENTHIFELKPSDWKLIFKHSGWDIVDELIYRQYPLRSCLRLMKPIWRKYDFEGFYGVILKKNSCWADCYKS